MVMGKFPKRLNREIVAYNSEVFPDEQGRGRCAECTFSRDTCLAQLRTVFHPSSLLKAVGTDLSQARNQPRPIKARNPMSLDVIDSGQNDSQIGRAVAVDVGL
jgi:hypothetical protein